MNIEDIQENIRLLEREIYLLGRLESNNPIALKRIQARRENLGLRMAELKVEELYHVTQTPGE